MRVSGGRRTACGAAARRRGGAAARRRGGAAADSGPAESTVDGAADEARVPVAVAAYHRIMRLRPPAQPRTSWRPALLFLSVWAIFAGLLSTPIVVSLWADMAGGTATATVVQVYSQTRYVVTFVT